MNSLEKFIIWCSQGNQDALKGSKNIEKNKFLAIGIILIVYWVFIYFASYFAIHTVIESDAISKILGFAVAVLIISLSRILTTPGREIARSNIWRGARIFITIAVSTTLAFSFMLGAFQDKINNRAKEIRFNNLDSIKAEYARDIQFNEKFKRYLTEEYNKLLFAQNQIKTINKSEIDSLNEEIKFADSNLTHLHSDLIRFEKDAPNINLGIKGKFDTLFRLLNEELHNKLKFYGFILVFLFLGLTPIILNILISRSDYYDNLDKIENLVSQNSDSKESLKIDFQNYCNVMVNEFEQKINYKRTKASGYLTKGLTIIFATIFFYIVVVYAFAFVYLSEKKFVTQDIYIMVSISVIFMFLQFLGGWFLKQYRNYLNTSLFLFGIKSNIQKYLLSYYAIIEFTDGKEKEKSLRDLLAIINNEFKNSNNELLNFKEDNYPENVIQAVNYLKKTLTNNYEKLK